MNRFEEVMVADRSLDLRSTIDFPGDVVGTVGWQQGMVWNGYGPNGPATVDSSMALSAVFACLRLLSEAIATLPLDTFERKGGTRAPYRPRPDYLSFDPPHLSRISYLSQVMLSLLTDGNAYIATPRDNLGVPVALVPLDPDLVCPRRQLYEPTPQLPYQKGEVYYEVNGDHYSRFDIMHITGMTLPGQLRGVSPLRAAREVIEGNAKAQAFGKNFLGNMAVPPAVIEMPEIPGNDAVAEQARAVRMAETWHATHGGTNNAGKVAVLTAGAKLTTVAMSPEDAQWLDSKKFGISEIARFYGVPPHLIADASNSTSWGSGLAEQNLAFGQFSLRPWTERIEEAHGRLLTSHGLPTVFLRLNLDALLRASLKDRYESYQLGIGANFLTINEARAYEDLAPVPWGDRPMAQAAPGGAP